MPVQLPLDHLADLWPREFRGAKIAALLHPASVSSKLEHASPQEAGQIFSRLIHVSEATGARIADDAGGEALTVALKAAGLTRAKFAGIIDKHPDAAALKAMFETLSFNKARVLLTYWDWAVMGTGPYARTVAS